jgi:exodeoxyribonuclease V gamma subunit
LPPFATPLPPRSGADPRPRTLAALRRALENPPRHYLQQRLDLRLPREEEPWPDSEPFAHDDGRQRFQLAQRVYAELRDGRGDDPERLCQRLLAEGLLPPAASGAVRLEAALALAAPGAQAARAWSPDPAQAQPFQFELDGEDFGGRFDAVHARGLVQFRPGAAHGRVQLAFGLEHLAWHAAGETRPVLRLIAGEPPLELPRLPRAEAQQALRSLRALAAQAAREALPFLPRAGYAWYAARASGAEALEAARRCWCGGEGQAGEGEDAWVRLALRGQDPFADADADAQARFQQLACAVFDALPASAAERADG